jgi:hypothetical protein
MTTYTCMAPAERSTPNRGVTRFLGDTVVAQVCQDLGVQRLHARSPIAHSRVPIIALVKELIPWRPASRLSCRGGVYECDGYNHATVHCMILQQVLVTNSNSCFSIGRTYIVSTSLLLIRKGSDACFTTSTSRYVHERKIMLTR